MEKETVDTRMTGEPGEPRKPYVRPQLTVHGDIAQITGLVTKGASDGVTGSQVV